MEQFLGILIPSVFIAVSGHLIWKSTDAFETAADFLGRKMSQGVKGATINAIASSMPEFLTTLFFLFTVRDKGEFVDSFSGGLGVVAGSAVFNILIIPLAIIFFGNIRAEQNKFSLDIKVIRRDGLFLVFANVVFILLISRQLIGPLHGLALLLIYLIYLFLLRKGFGFDNTDSHDDAEHRVGRQKLHPRHYLTLQLKQLLLNGKTLNTFNAWTTLLVATFFMSLGTWLLVKGTEWLGDAHYELFGLSLQGLDLPLVFLSVLLAAAATSIPDTMVSVRDARKGNHDDSISNAIGSNIFDLSFALGIPLLLYTLIHGPIEMSYPTRVLSVSFWLAMWIVNIVIVPVFIIRRKLNRKTGIILALLYVFFIFYVVEETSGNGMFRSMAEWVIGLF